ncbi:MAG: hypothetical protein LBQ66_15520 [Planctomycetaceae bacterium]|jgi:hypothetical protein|nr:hypothetical protein [Planctomycetaceae bacterium]
MVGLLDGAVQIGEKRGIKIGEELGKELGIKIGAERATKDMILTCLSTRFKRAVPSDIRESVESYSDAVALNSLFQSALTCQSFSEFKKDLVR